MAAVQNVEDNDDGPLPTCPDPHVDPAGYLRSIQAVRERCGVVFDKARRNELRHFEVDWSKFDETSKWVEKIIRRDFQGDYSKIPPHGRWQHFEVGGRPRVGQLISTWPNSIVDVQEQTRRLIDLFMVSVLLDAGAGTQWSYRSKENGRLYNRSEGLAVASIEMFKAGAFSSDPVEKCQVDAEGLKQLTVQYLGKGLQVSEHNPIEGLEGRTGLLQRLGDALAINPEMFGATARPGNMLDYLLAHPTTEASGGPVIQVTTLWDVLMTGLAPIWPASRHTINNIPLGDCWPCTTMPSTPDWANFVPFHKLTQWLAYSLMGPMERLMGARFRNIKLMTGLPEYRNGGLLIDTGLLTLKEADRKVGERQYHEHMKARGVESMEVVPAFEPSDDVVVEWRAVTVGFLDEIAKSVNERLGLTGKSALSLAQVLEAGTWKGGREIAAVSRPNTKEPPIMIISDGTVF
ncbi:DUF1688-domain-containing protein [Microthyrium microscopicum]|uniref:DUF1688-domain-containing protein n=1 Tax=Microthyrium microscopicum TaxID=703497 RepID=A0A6A6USE7_9PEZI|nr:DUF1688-domain-containing protein [Microthyrium microscopicum]